MAEDIELLLTPIDSIRIDVAQIVSLMQKNHVSGGARGGDSTGKFQRARKKFDKSVINLNKITDKRFGNIPDLFGSQVKKFQVGMQRILSTKRIDKTLRSVNDKFDKTFGQKISKNFIKALDVFKKDKNVKSLSDALQNQANIFAQKLSKSSAVVFASMSQQFGQGLKSTVQRSLSFLPDFLKRPITKMLGNQIDKFSKNIATRFKNSKMFTNILSSLLSFVGKFGIGLTAAGATMGLLIKMFRSTQQSWTNINRQFGMFVMSFRRYADTAYDFMMQTGLSMKAFSDAASATIKQFGFLDVRAVTTGAKLSRVFGLSSDEAAKLQRVIGGPGHSITSTLDNVSRAVIQFGGQGNKVFRDIIRLGDKFRILTQKQRLSFIKLSSQLSSMGASSEVVVGNMDQMFSSIDTAMESTKQMNLRLLQMSLNSGQVFKMFNATRAIDLYKAMRIGDVDQAFKVLSKQMGPDFISQFDKIESVARKKNFLKTAFGDVEAGQKVMDQWRNMLDTFGTSDVQEVKKKIGGMFDFSKNQKRLEAFGAELEKMRMSTDRKVRKQARKIFLGGQKQLAFKLKAKVTADVQNIKTFQDFASATKTLTMRFSQMWNAFKRGFLKALLPAMQAFNKVFSGIRANKRQQVLGKLGFLLGTVIIGLSKLLGVIRFVSWGLQKLSEAFTKLKIGVFIRQMLMDAGKNMQLFGKFVASTGAWIFKAVQWMGSFLKLSAKTVGFISKSIGIFGKILGPIGLVITAFQAISNMIQYMSSKKSLIENITIGITSIIDAILSPIYTLINFVSGSNIKGLTNHFFGPHRASGDYVTPVQGGVQRTVGQGGQAQIISPVPMLRKIVAESSNNQRVLRAIQQSNSLMKKMIQRLGKPVNIIGGKMKVDGDFAHIVDRQLSYANG